MRACDFIHDRLYYKGEGYFAKQNNQLGVLSDPIPFSQIFGYEDYVRILHERYPPNAWLTPSEIFKPYYGMTIASYIDQTLNEYKDDNMVTKSQNLKIIEVGAGNGSAAISILNYLKLYRPQVYKNISYTIVEISEPLTLRCKTLIQKAHPQLISQGQIKFKNQSILDFSETSNQLTFVLLLEVLDNMPHDRVYFTKEGQLKLAYVEQEADGSYKEVQEPNAFREIEDLYKLWKDQEKLRPASEISDKSEGIVD